MKLSFLGACREVGRSAVFLETEKGVRLLLDSGVKVHDHYETHLQPPAPPHAVVVSHAHLDHSGGAPITAKKLHAPFFATFPTIPLSALLYEDSIKIARQEGFSLPFGATDLHRLDRLFYPLPYEQPYEFHDGTTLELLDAGHIVGSAMPVVRERSGRSLLYTGDFKTLPTRMHNGCSYPEEPVNTLVIESSYADREQEPRAQLEQDFVEDVRGVLEEDGVALVPCFAIGRTQEILQVLHKANLHAPIYTQGMGEKASQIFSEYSSYVRDPKALNAALAAAKPVAGRSKRRILQGPSVIVCTAGMLDGGPALEYLAKLNESGHGAVLLTGYQVEGTNGRRLIETSCVRYKGRLLKITLPMKWRSFSAHSSKSELFSFVKGINPEKVFCVHGDDKVCQSFAAELNEQGFEAAAPEAGQKFEV